MKYPLDQFTFNEFLSHVVSHANAQTTLFLKLTGIIKGAMDASEHDDDDWYKEADSLFKDIHDLNMHHESRRWSEMNFQNQMNSGAYKAPPQIFTPTVSTQNVKPEINLKEELPALNNINIQFDIGMDQKANREEAKFGQEMTEEDLEKHFNQKRAKIKKEQPKTLDKMTLDEIREWEKTQDNSTDIYKIKARVSNLARGGNASLTPQGEMLCNTYTHVMKAFYDFADKVADKNVKISLLKLIRLQEGMPGTLIAAAGVGVKTKK